MESLCAGWRGTWKHDPDLGSLCEGARYRKEVRRETYLAFCAMQVGYPFLSSPRDPRQAEKPYKIETSGGTRAPPITFALRALQGVLFLQGRYVWKVLSPWNLVSWLLRNISQFTQV